MLGMDNKKKGEAEDNTIIALEQLMGAPSMGKTGSGAYEINIQGVIDKDKNKKKGQK